MKSGYKKLRYLRVLRGRQILYRVTGDEAPPGEQAPSAYSESRLLEEESLSAFLLLGGAFLFVVVSRQTKFAPSASSAPPR